MSELLKINNLSGGYYKEEVVKDVSLKIKKADFLGIIGPNGSGKTTLLRFATRVIMPRKGEIYLRQKNILSMPLKEFCRSVGFVSQGLDFDFSFSVFEFVLMGRIPHLKRLQQETRKDFEIAKNSLLATDTLHLKDKLIGEISFGERQRVNIAKVLTQEPVLLFLDEPTAHLDIGHQIQILDLLKKLNREINLTVVMVLHDLNLASAYCNRLVLFNEGRIFKEGAPEDVLTYQNIEAVYKTVVLVNKNPLTGKPNIILVPSKAQGSL